MRLVSFSVQDYRSISSKSTIQLSHYSLLVGANNEGKSNLLHALALGMDTLVNLQDSFLRSNGSRILRRHGRSFKAGVGDYHWEQDFPVGKQQKNNPKTIITLEFQLDECEVIEFQKEIKSNLNGSLPLRIEFSQDNSFDVKVRKQGKGKANFERNSNKIAQFIANRIAFEYIPAIRTEAAASRVIEHLLSKELRKLQQDQEYKDLLDNLDRLQQPVFDELAKTIQNTVSSFLPSVSSVRLETRRAERYSSLRRDVDIIIDDGSSTLLERKGDGVKSLVALALMRHVSEQSSKEKNTIIAIEEPESHLHPNAIHELRTVIESLSRENQVVLTSHSPLFVDPLNLRNTIIVKDSRAGRAKHLGEIRETLGVRFSDNLENASLVLLFEGSDDVTAMKGIINNKSAKLAAAIKAGQVSLDSLGGASSLRSKASTYTSGACQVQAFLDDDSAGRKAETRVLEDNILKIRDINKCNVPHLNEAELEDLYDTNVYKEGFLMEWGVDPSANVSPKYSKEKWSKKMEERFSHAGKVWDNKVQAQVKLWLAEFAAKHPGIILRQELSSPVAAFIQTAESKLPSK